MVRSWRGREKLAREREAGAGEADVKEFEEGTTLAERKAQMAAILSAVLTMNQRGRFISSWSITGLAPWNAEGGDLVCVLLGCTISDYLKESRFDGHYVLIGEAYVEGYMEGEAVTEWKEGKLKSKIFEIL